MSISTATDRLASPRRVPPRHMVGAVLLALGLIAIVVAIAISSTTSSARRQSARPTPINTTHAQPTGAGVSTAPGARFRDPATHALLAVDTPAAPQPDSSLGHRMNP